ncbi:MAG: ATP-binding cassette domain-containing protein [Bradyrhizobium sp.]|nr:ATP-binding cassette domain-containing protein [Bradyrhizobium sp.]
MSSAPILALENLTMRFGGIVAVNALSFSAQRKQITALIGPNGAGKTTVFNCITGFYKPTSGVIRLTHDDGTQYEMQKLKDFNISKQAKVARTFQNIRLFPGMTALENLMVAQHNALMRASGLTLLGLLGVPSWRTAEQSAIDNAVFWLKRVGLLDRADDAAGNLAYGDQRRLEIARALLHRPRLLLLDEATVGLDVKARADIVGHVRQLVTEQGIGVLWATHLFDEIAATDDLVVLHQGRVLARGPVPQVIAEAGAADVNAAFARLTTQASPSSVNPVSVNPARSADA